MKYRVGDKVRVISGLVVDGAYGNWAFTEKMKKYKGKSVTISEVCQDYYRIKEDEEYGYYTDEMFEPVEEIEEMSAEEAIRLQGEICMSLMCRECPIDKLRGDSHLECTEFRAKHPEEIVKILKQWKADHEKKPIETENVIYIVVMDEKRNVVYEEKTNKEIAAATQKDEVLKKYCEEHDGKYYAISERRCVVKE